MRTQMPGILVAAILGAVATHPASAHHSAVAEFDVMRPVLISGTVKNMRFSNPHSWLYVDVKTTSGEVQEWAIEGSAPNQLLRRGWNKNSLPTGTAIKVRGFQARDGSNRAIGLNVTLADGSTLTMGAAPVN